MTLSKKTVRNYPVLSNILYRLGIVERRQGVPNTRKGIEVAFLTGIFVVVIMTALAVTWAVQDNYKSKVIEQAAYANPGCDDVKIVSKESVNEGTRYTVTACGNVSTYVVNRNL